MALFIYLHFSTCQVTSYSCFVIRHLSTKKSVLEKVANIRKHSRTFALIRDKHIHQAHKSFANIRKRFQTFYALGGKCLWIYKFLSKYKSLSLVTKLMQFFMKLSYAQVSNFIVRWIAVFLKVLEVIKWIFLIQETAKSVDPTVRSRKCFQNLASSPCRRQAKTRYIKVSFFQNLLDKSIWNSEITKI